MDIVIRGIVKKKSSGGKDFASILTNGSGTFTCWDSGVILNLEKSKGKLVSVDVEEKNGFKTIKGIEAVGEAVAVEAEPAYATDKMQERNSEILISTLTSYAKDIFVELRSKNSTGSNSELASAAVDAVMQIRGLVVDALDMEQQLKNE